MLFAISLQSNLALAQKVSKSEYIKLGMSNALTGPTKKLGQDLKLGSSAYFKRLNQNGGVNGKQVELVSLDDGYEPRNTVGNTRKLIETEQVFALFGYVGTPTSYAILPILKKSGIPYLMPFTGADFLRKPVLNNIFNLRASYYQEAQAQIDYLVNKLSFKNIALVIQADEFGLVAQRAITAILTQHGLKPTVTTRFKRNSSDIGKALIQLKQKPVDAVIFVGTYQPFSHLINLAYQQEFKPLFTSLSFIASQNVYDRLDQPSKVMISEVMPDPKQCQWQLCHWFISDMEEIGIKKINRVQLEGYLNAFVFSQAAMNCPVTLTQQCLLKELEKFSFKDNGLEVKFSADNHQGLQQVYFSFSDAAKAYQK